MARTRTWSSAFTSSASSTKLRKPRTARKGSDARRATSSRQRSKRLGGRRGTKASGSGSSGISGESESRMWERSTPEAPSIVQWWILVMSAKPSPSSRPSTTHVSQSGRLRSSGWAMIRAESFFSWACVPGRGSAVWRTW